MNKSRNSFYRRAVPMILSIVMLLSIVPLQTWVSGATDKFVLPEPILTNLTMVRYWGYNSTSTNRSGRTAETPAKSLGDISSELEQGGKIVIVDKGWISGKTTLAPASTVVITGKGPDGTYYYDPESPDLSSQTGQKGMFMINSLTTFTVGGRVVFDETVILERNSNANLSTVSVVRGGVLHIKDTVQFASSAGGKNTKLSVAEGGSAIIESAGFSSYSGNGTIYIDKSLIGTAVTEEQFSTYRGKLYRLEGERICDVTGHDLYYTVSDGKHVELCYGCDHRKEWSASFSYPELVNTDTQYFWAYTGADTNDGTSVSTPKKSITHIASVMNSGGTIYPVGKGYMGGNASPDFGGTVKFTAILPDGTDARESSSEFGALMWPTGATFSIVGDTIMEKVNLYSRQTTAPQIVVKNNATLLLRDVECKVSKSNYPTTAIEIAAGSVVIMQGDNVGRFSSITGSGVLVVDERLVENGRITKSTVENFDGIVLTEGNVPVVFSEQSPRVGIEPNDVFLTGSFTDSKGTTIPYRYYIPENYDESRVYPVVLHMHGNGSRGSDNEKQLTVFSACLNTEIFQSSYDAIIIAPQCPSSSEWVPSLPATSDFMSRTSMSKYLNAAKELLDSFLSGYSTDTDRVYAIGTSNGGGAVWELMYRFPDLFAAAIPMAGARDASGAAKFAEKIGNTAIWAFHGTQDTTVPVEGTRGICAALAAAGKNVTYTEVKGSTHNNIWYDASSTVGIVDWLFSHTKNTSTSPKVGDMNLDGSFTNGDISLVVRHLAGWQTGYSGSICDIDSDGKLSNRDAISMILMLEQTANGVPSVFYGIGSIAEYNEKGEADSHADDTESSMLESNFRETYLLDKNDLGIDTLFYPRIKKLADGSYIMLYQDADNGKSVYYATSPDMKNWTYRGLLFRKSATGSKWYSTADACVLANGDLIVIACYYTSYVGDPIGNGLVLKRSKNNGQTWSTEKIIYKGTCWEPSILQLTSGEIEVFWTNTHVKGVAAELGGRTDDNSTGTMMIRSFDNGNTWTGDLTKAYSGQIVAQQKTKTGTDGNYYSGQMPVAVQLNNGKIALAIEVRVPKESDPTSSTYNMAFAYTDGNDPWPHALGDDEQGPATLVPNAYTSKAGPYIRQFYSGETVFTHHWGVTWYYFIGDSNASYTSFAESKNDGVFFDDTWVHIWGCLEITDTHVITGTIPAHENKGIYVGNRYLNHTLTAKSSTVDVDGRLDDWSDTGEAFYVGSSTQAQASIRVKRDTENVYFAIEALDKCITSADRVTLRLSSGTSGKQVYLTVYANGESALTDENGQAISAGGAECRVYMEGTYEQFGDEDVGYAAEVKLPISLFSTGTLRIAPIIYNKDSKYETPIADMISNMSVDDRSGWLKIKLS